MVAAEVPQAWPEATDLSLLEGGGTSVGVQCNVVSVPHSAGRNPCFESHYKTSL